jgi:hypothetical protein
VSSARYAVRIVRTGSTPQPVGSSARLDLLDHEAKLGVKTRTDWPALYSSRIIKAAALLTDTKMLLSSGAGNPSHDDRHALTEP